LHMTFMSDRLQNYCDDPPPYIAFTISTTSRGGVKINVSCYMIIRDFLTSTPPPGKNGSRAPESKWLVLEEGRGVYVFYAYAL